MSNYQNAGVGLRKMYVAAIGIIACGVLLALPVVKYLGALGIIAFFVVDLTAYYTAGKDIAGCKVAFIVRMISILISVSTYFVTVPGRMELAVATVKELTPLISLCLVFLSVSKVLRENGAEDVAKQGVRTWWIYLGCHIVMFLVTEILPYAVLLGGNFSQSMLILGLFLVLALVVSIAALVFQLKFFKCSAEQFGVYL